MSLLRGLARVCTSTPGSNPFFRPNNNNKTLPELTRLAPGLCWPGGTPAPGLAMKALQADTEALVG